MSRPSPSVPSCSQHSPRTPPWGGTRLAPAGLTGGCWGCAHAAPQAAAGAKPAERRAMQEVEGAGGCTPPQHPSTSALAAALGTHGCSPRVAAWTCTGCRASCCHAVTAAAVGCWWQLLPPLPSPQILMGAGATAGKAFAVGLAAFLGLESAGGGRSGAGAWRDSATACWGCAGDAFGAITCPLSPLATWHTPLVWGNVSE